MENRWIKKKQLSEPLVEQSTLLNFRLPPLGCAMACAELCFLVFSPRDGETEKGEQMDLKKKQISNTSLTADGSKENLFFPQKVPINQFSLLKWKSHVTNCFSIVLSQCR